MCPASVRAAPTATIDRCNGHVELCDRSLNEVAFAVAHNAMSNEEDGWYQPNQHWPVRRALREGVRGLMLDVYEYQDEAHTCHTICRLGHRSLRDELCDIAGFLDAEPTEVVMIIIESHVSNDTITAAFSESGLLPYVARLSDTPALPVTRWPTLRELIVANRRLVVFTESPAWWSGKWQENTWLLPFYTQAFETRYGASHPDGLDCTPGRGRVGAGLFLLNHFLTDLFGSEDLASTVNGASMLREHISRCRRELGVVPRLVAVDYYDVGDVLSVVDELNGT
jgi:hypothetical protein